MNRRHFIRITSASLAGLISGRLSTLAAGGADRMDNPLHAFALIDSVWIPLASSGSDKFIGKDIEVALQRTNAALSVYISSPTHALRGIRLAWPLSIRHSAKCLGDQWERTYGDEQWEQPEKVKIAPWYLLTYDHDLTTCFGVRTSPNAFCSWSVSPRQLELFLDTHSAGVGVQLGQRRLHAADIVTTKGIPGENVFSTAQRFCRTMCANPRLPAQSVYGINDWYYAYGNNNPRLILEQSRMMSDLASDTNNRPFSVIDAGWAAYSPLLPNDCCWQDDFSRPNEKFRDMGKLAGQIKELGMRAGLWTRPLCGKHDDPANLLLPKIPGRNDPRNPVLDPSIEENIARIQYNIGAYKQWGFELVKHDFSTFDITGKWGFQMTDRITEEGWRFRDDTRTTVEVIRNLYQSIRDAAGDMYLIGCNTLSHPSAGLFELNRIGDDTSGKEWDRTRKMGVNTLGFRMIQHKAFYSVDGDCVGLTREVPWNMNKQWMQLLAESSTPLFISAQPDAVGTEQRAFIKDCFSQAARRQPIGEPLDWMETQRPTRWRLNGQEVQFDWGLD